MLDPELLSFLSLDVDEQPKHMGELSLNEARLVERDTHYPPAGFAQQREGERQC